MPPATQAASSSLHVRGSFSRAGRRHRVRGAARCAQQPEPQQPAAFSGLSLLSLPGVPRAALVGAARLAWRQSWLALMRELAPQSTFGAYVRPPSSLVASSPLAVGGAPLRLVVGLPCPWCHRATLVRALLQLEPTVALTVLQPDPSAGGWSGVGALYDAGAPGHRSRRTLPLLLQGGRAVSNDSAQICALLGALPAPGCTTLRPPGRDAELDLLCASIAVDVNQGVYASGFATSQAAYDGAQARLWPALAALEARLGRTRFLLGGQVSLADVFLFPTCVRFDAVYGPLFRCGARRLSCDFPNLRGWARDVYRLRGVAATVDVEATRRSYHESLFPLNASGILPHGPTAADLGLGADPGRGSAEGGGVFATRG